MGGPNTITNLLSFNPQGWPLTAALGDKGFTDASCALPPFRSDGVLFEATGGHSCNCLLISHATSPAASGVACPPEALPRRRAASTSSTSLKATPAPTRLART